MPKKFFVNKEQVEDGTIYIEGMDVNHIENVLRYGIGDNIIICDGEGMDYECEILEMQKDKIITKIVDKNSLYTEPKFNVTIYQGLPKGDKMEYIIEKSVELGAVRIVPVAMKNCVVKIEDGKKEQKKIERWNKISEAAAKQSGRGIIPKIENVMDFTSAVRNSKNDDIKILLYENEKKLTIHEIFDISKVCTNISVFIGPEGGLSESEVKIAKDNGIQVATLGNRILRTETVSTVILAIIMYSMGEI